MEEEKISKIIEVLLNLKQYEWRKVAAAVNMYFSSESNKITLSDPERLRRVLELSINGKISHSLNSNSLSSLGQEQKLQII